MNAACLSREDAACLKIRAMEEQNHGSMTHLGQKAMGEKSLVNYRKRKEGEIAPRDTLYPTMQFLSDSEMQPTHHSRKSDMYKEAVKGAVMIWTDPGAITRPWT